MSYLIDTNVLSELRRRDRADAGVAAWADSVPAFSLYLSVISILEIEAGMLMTERRDREQGAMLREWIDARVLPAFANRMLAIDVAVAQCCARLHGPDPRAERDALIAATAIVHRMTVVTRNVRDFEPMGVKTLNPWSSRQPT